YNRGSLSDARVKVHCGDAARFLRTAPRGYDIVLADFTFPADLAGCSLFTEDFFSKVRSVISRRGLFALNAVSPEKFPPAYWAIYKTLRAAGFYPKPLSASIPSFSAHGYGRWGFFFSSPRAITPGELARLRLPPAAGFLTREKLRENMRFPKPAVLFGCGLAAPLKDPSDLLALLNLPGPAAAKCGEVFDFFSRSNRALPGGGFPGDPAQWSAETLAAWEDRLAGLLGDFDWDKFIEEAGRLSDKAGSRLRDELDEFRAELPALFSGDGSRAQRVYRVLAVLAILLIMINMAYPDNAFAKGYSSHSGGNGEINITFISPGMPAPFHGQAFQFVALHPGLVPDSAGKIYLKKNFIFPQGGAAPAAPASGSGSGKPFYAVTDSMQLTADGDALLVLSPLPYAYKIEPERFVLFREGSAEPLFNFRPDPEALQTLSLNIQLQQKALAKALSAHLKWMAWTAPAGAVLPPIKAESREGQLMLEIKAALEKAAAKLAAPPREAAPAGFIKLAPGVYADQAAGSVVFLRDDGDLVSFPMPGLSPVEDAVQIAPGTGLTAFVRALLVNKAKILPLENPARRLGEMDDDAYQKLNPGR
ncbi:MAG TPA: hypothetical protein PKI19_02245, partial [Elusimicrobiales bacterium]|nr:hypothetical protein [Elusimicrobiales bacterium]